MGDSSGRHVLWDPKAAMEAKRRRRFERRVEECLALLRPRIGHLMENLVFEAADEPPADKELLGEYLGIPRSHRTDYTMVLPDRIVLYRKPMERAARSTSELKKEICRTIVHEIAHHLGMDEEDILRLLGPEYA